MFEHLFTVFESFVVEGGQRRASSDQRPAPAKRKSVSPQRHREHREGRESWKSKEPLYFSSHIYKEQLMVSNFAIYQQTGLMSGIFSLSYYLSDRYATDRYIVVGDQSEACWNTIETLLSSFDDDFFRLVYTLFSIEEAQKKNSES